MLDDLESINIESMKKRRADLARRSASEFDRAVFRGEMGVKEAVEAAILAERDRCAGIVEASAKSFRHSADALAKEPEGPDAEMLLHVELLGHLAAAIRKGEA